MKEDDILALLSEPSPRPAILAPLASNSPAFYMDKALLESEHDRLLAKLKTKGITDIRNGLEIEIVLHEFPLPGAPHDKHGKLYWERQKEKGLAAFDRRIEEAEDGMSRMALVEQRKIYSKLNAREVLFHELVNDKDIVPLIQPHPLKYYPEREALSYYDNPDVFEVKTHTHDARETAAINAKIIHKVESLMADYDLGRASEYCYHYNFSLWKDGRNITNPAEPEFKTTGRDSLQGVAQALRQSPPVLFGKKDLERPRLPNVSVGPARTMSLRIAGNGEEGHVELPLVLDDNLHNMTLLGNIIAAGALHGLENPQARHESEAMEVKRRVFTQPKGYDPWYVTHVLNGLTVEKDGSVKLWEPYTRKNTNILAPIMGLPPIKATGTRATDMRQKQEETLVDFFKNVKITEDAGHIHIAYPHGKGISDDKIAWLEKNITAVDLVPTYSLDPGLVGLAISPTPRDRKGEYIARMQESPVLSGQFSPHFMEELRGALSAVHEPPSELALANARKTASAPPLPATASGSGRS